MKYTASGVRWWRPYDFPPEHFRRFSPTLRRRIAESAKRQRLLLEAVHAPDGQDPHPFVMDPTGNRAAKAMGDTPSAGRAAIVYVGE